MERMTGIRVLHLPIQAPNIVTDRYGAHYRSTPDGMYSGLLSHQRQVVEVRQDRFWYKRRGAHSRVDLTPECVSC